MGPKGLRPGTVRRRGLPSRTKAMHKPTKPSQEQAGLIHASEFEGPCQRPRKRKICIRPRIISCPIHTAPKAVRGLRQTPKDSLPNAERHGGPRRGHDMVALALVSQADGVVRRGRRWIFANTHQFGITLLWTSADMQPFWTTLPTMWLIPLGLARHYESSLDWGPLDQCCQSQN